MAINVVAQVANHELFERLAQIALKVIEDAFEEEKDDYQPDYFVQNIKRTSLENALLECVQKIISVEKALSLQSSLWCGVSGTEKDIKERNYQSHARPIEERKADYAGDRQDKSQPVRL
jgi:hypothetical protein